MPSFDSLVVLGPTASGKTRLGVRIARKAGGEILSADSRQVYRDLNIGSGKDLDEYREGGPPVPHHLIDIVGLDREFSVFDYHRSFFEAFADVQSRNKTPVVVGGTGLYLESVIRGYEMVEAPVAPEFRERVAGSSDSELLAQLTALRPELHNSTDTSDRERILRALEIAQAGEKGPVTPARRIHPFILGMRWERSILRERIRSRLKERIEAGLIEEVEGLRESGVPDDRLDWLGLEYRFVLRFLRGEIRNRNDLFQKLSSAIIQFAKRQETWFRRMERKGIAIHWIAENDPDPAVASLIDVGSIPWPG